MADMQTVVAQPVNLRAVETFIKDYKKLTPEDVKNLERMSYEDFQKRLRTDPVKVMVEASDLGLDLGQYGNLVSPQTYLEQKRSIMSRLMQDEGIFVNNTDMSAPSTVGECLDGAHRQAMLFHTLTKVWDKNTVQDRSAITLQSSSPPGQPPNVGSQGQPPPVPVGLRLNPGELVATSHGIDTNQYNPFKWQYERGDMQRNKVRPAQTIPASTLGEQSGNIPMAKWGNRFVLPYEMLIGGQGMRINKLASMIALDASTESVRQYAELLGVLQNGDPGATADNGLVQAAEVEGVSTYDGGTSGAPEFTFTAFLNWLDEALTEPFQISHVIMLKAQQRQLRAQLAMLQGNLAFEQLSSVGLAPNGMTNMEGQGNIRYGRAPEGSLNANYVLGLDARFAVEKVNRNGMTIRQQAENIANQTRDVVISDTYLWARMAVAAVKVLNVNA